MTFRIREGLPTAKVMEMEAVVATTAQIVSKTTMNLAATTPKAIVPSQHLVKKKRRRWTIPSPTLIL